MEPVDTSSLVALRQLQPPDRPDVVGRIVSRFLEESEQRLAALRQAVEADDPLALERSAHAMKGIAGTVGANEISDLARRLEHIGRAGRTDEGSQLVQELESALARARPIFDGLMDPNRPGS